MPVNAFDVPARFPRTEWRTIELGARAIDTLLRETQDLPESHPLKLTVEIILDRWAESDPCLAHSDQS